jgi:hypothetical protein
VEYIAEFHILACLRESIEHGTQAWVTGGMEKVAGRKGVMLVRDGLMLV